MCPPWPLLLLLLWLLADAAGLGECKLAWELLARKGSSIKGEVVLFHVHSPLSRAAAAAFIHTAGPVGGC